MQDRIGKGQAIVSIEAVRLAQKKKISYYAAKSQYDKIDTLLDTLKYIVPSYVYDKV